jgi:hypothetical protein
MTDRMKNTTVDAETGGGTALMMRRPVLALVISLLIVVAGWPACMARKSANCLTSTGR